jgi:hypothetical protein
MYIIKQILFEGTRLRSLIFGINYYYSQNFWETYCFCLRRLSVRSLSVRIKLARPSQVKLLVGFQPNFTGVISTIPSCEHHPHVPLGCTKWPPELKIEEINCPPSTRLTTCGISTKLYRSDQYHP